MAIYKNTPPIVTNGLVLALDAANPKSYVSGSTIWNNLANPLLSGSLVNGPTFSSANGGSIVFDGTNDYVVVNNIALTGNISITISGWVNVISNLQTDNGIFVYGRDGTQLQVCGIYYRTSDPNVRFTAWGGTGVDYQTGFVKDFNVWHYWTIVYNTTSVSIYRDGIIDPVGSVLRNLNFTLGTLLIGGTVGNGAYNNQYTSNSQIYNRALSAQEVLQNYNATKGRFNII
jgi:hypothetical protein